MKISVSGIRGVVGKDLTLRDILKFSKNFSVLINSKKCVIATDTRPTGQMLAETVKAVLMQSGVDVYDLGNADLTNVDFSGADLRQVYIKSSKMENVVTNSDTKTDSCFKTDIINKIICKIFRIFTPSSPSYETTIELLENYILRSNSD